jgi:hypothetical protein
MTESRHSADKSSQRPTPAPAVDIRSIPALKWATDEMHRRWIVWLYVWNEERQKWDKPPKTIHAGNARSNDPATWVDFETAWSAVQRSGFDGPGFMLHGLAPELFGAIDLDDVRDPETGALLPWVQQLLMRSPSYAEITPSGTGIRILGTASRIATIHTRIQHPEGGSFELFVNCKRYITVSGNQLAGHDVFADISDLIEDLARLRASPSTPLSNGADHGPINLSSLPYELCDVIVHGQIGGQPVEHRGKEFFRVVRYLKACNHTVAEVLALLNAYPEGIAAKFAGRLETEVNRAWGKLAEVRAPSGWIEVEPGFEPASGPETGPESGPEPEPEPGKSSRKRKPATEAELDAFIDRFNRRYAVVNDGGKALVFEQVQDPLRQRLMLTRIGFEDFRKLYMNRWLTVEFDTGQKDGDDKPMMEKITNTHAGWWLSSARRRQYLGGVVFDPKNEAPADRWNLWTGFSVKPKPGRWDLMQDHIRRVICGGDEGLYAYVLNLVARMFQQPDRPGEVALVLRGKRGSGKGIFLNWLWRAWGQHACHISNAKHLTGNFNAHLRDCVMLYADEAFFAGDRANEGVLKALITEPSLPIEGKYQNLVEVLNMLHVFMSSNSDWVVPAAIDERRFCVIDVADNRVGDRAYFKAIAEQMENGGLAALIHDMLHRDISKFEVRDIPMTAALREQKTLSLGSIERWWLAMLERGFVWQSRHGAPWFAQWHDFYTTELLWNSYVQWREGARPYDHKRREQLGRFLSNTYQASRPWGEHPVHEIESIDRRGAIPDLDEIAIVRTNNPRGFRVGELEEARARFLELHDVDTNWGDVGQSG